MAKEQPPVAPENVLDVDISAIALDERFGSLKFENADKKLTAIQRYVREAKDLQYGELLLKSQVNQIENFQKRLVERLQWLQKFDLSTNPNPKHEHDSFEQEVDGLYNDVYGNLVMVFLPFLREERRRENPGEKTLDEEVRKATQLRTELEEELKKVREETEKIRTTGKEVGVAKGERATVRLAAYFDSEMAHYQKAANWWFRGVVGGYIAVLVVLVIFGTVAVLYLNNLFSTANGQWNLGIVWSVGVAKLIIIAAFWYGLSFIIKNYNVNSHLAAVNRHRAAVARTLEDFMAVEQQQEKPRLAEILQNATDAMFKLAPIGFVSKTEKENGQPILQIVNDLVGLKN